MNQLSTNSAALSQQLKATRVRLGYDRLEMVMEPIGSQEQIRVYVELTESSRRVKAGDTVWSDSAQIIYPPRDDDQSMPDTDSPIRLLSPGTRLTEIGASTGRLKEQEAACAA